MSQAMCVCVCVCEPFAALDREGHAVLYARLYYFLACVVNVQGYSIDKNDGSSSYL